MSNVLIKHAVANVWCTPNQDRQVYIKPTRLSTDRGFRRCIPATWGAIDLPNNDDLFHVYQLGSLPTRDIGVISDLSKWTNACDIISTDEVMIDLLYTNGFVYPRSQTWFKHLSSGNLIIAIVILDGISKLCENDLYFRFYANAYYASDRERVDSEGLTSQGLLVSLTSDMLILINKYYDNLAINPFTKVFKNGFWHQSLLPSEVKAGDVIEYVRDDSIVKEHVFDFKGLRTYYSETDKVLKYIIHPLKDGTSQIRYFDDAEFYITWESCNFLNTGKRIGVSLPRFVPSTIRQLTHRDYAVSAEVVSSILNEFAYDIIPGTARLVVSIRDSGYDRPLIKESNRIHELYKLHDTEITKAIGTVRSMVPFWEGNTLEDSAYARVMWSFSRKLDVDDVEELYGYAGAALVTADHYHVVNTKAGVRSVYIPSGLQRYCTAFEYDALGYLLGVVTSENIALYIPNSDLCTAVELIYGVGGVTLTETNNPDAMFDNTEEISIYCAEHSGGDLGPWKIAEGLINYDTSNVSWAIDLKQNKVVMRNSASWLCYGIDLEASSGVYEFKLSQVLNGVVTPLEVPFGNLDVWMNGKTLLEDIDYKFKFPDVVITNKEYLIDGEVQDIQIRYYGEPTTALLPIPKNDFGFVKHGMLSANNVYDIRDDMQVRCVVGGRVRDIKDLKFTEDGGVMASDIIEGQPYNIEYVNQHVSALTNIKSSAARRLDDYVRTHVSAYLNSLLPEKKDLGYVVIPRQHQIYSPYLSKILHDIKDGKINVGSEADRITDIQLAEILKDYKYLLDFDPCITPLDRDFVIVHAHQYYNTVNVSVREYWFLDRVAKLFLGSRVDLERLLTIGD